MAPAVRTGGSPQLCLLLALLGLSCAEKKAEPLAQLKPKPLPRLQPALVSDGGEDPDAWSRVEPAPVYGEPLPSRARRLRLSGHQVGLGSQVFSLDQPGELARLRAALGAAAPVLLEPDSEVYLAQAAPLLALLDDAGAETALLHPAGQVAFPLRLRDEPAFQAWLDEVKPGKVRVIHRADGFELTTGMGKLAGPDPNGPTVPLRGGKQDIATLRRGLGQVQARFGAEDLCFVPSSGMELSRVAEAVGANYLAMGEPIFTQTCLVYPRPRK